MHHVRVGLGRETRVRVPEVLRQLLNGHTLCQHQRGDEVPQRVHPVSAAPALDAGLPECAHPHDLVEQVARVELPVLTGREQPHRRGFALRVLSRQRELDRQEQLHVLLDRGEHTGRERNDALLAALRWCEHERAANGPQLALNPQHHAVLVDVVRRDAKDLPLPQTASSTERAHDSEPRIYRPLDLKDALLRPHDDVRAHRHGPLDRLGLARVLDDQLVLNGRVN